MPSLETIGFDRLIGERDQILRKIEVPEEVDEAGKTWAKIVDLETEAWLDAKKVSGAKRNSLRNLGRHNFGRQVDVLRLKLLSLTNAPDDPEWFRATDKKLAEVVNEEVNKSGIGSIRKAAETVTGGEWEKFVSEAKNKDASSQGEESINDEAKKDETKKKYGWRYALAVGVLGVACSVGAGLSAYAKKISHSAEGQPTPTAEASPTPEVKATSTLAAALIGKKLVATPVPTLAPSPSPEVKPAYEPDNFKVAGIDLNQPFTITYKGGKQFTMETFVNKQKKGMYGVDQFNDYNKNKDAALVTQTDIKGQYYVYMHDLWADNGQVLPGEGLKGLKPGDQMQMGQGAAGEQSFTVVSVNHVSAQQWSEAAADPTNTNDPYKYVFYRSDMLVPKDDDNLSRQPGQMILVSCFGPAFPKGSQEYAEYKYSERLVVVVEPAKVHDSRIVLGSFAQMANSDPVIGNAVDLAKAVNAYQFTDGKELMGDYLKATSWFKNKSDAEKADLDKILTGLVNPGTHNFASPDEMGLQCIGASGLLDGKASDPTYIGGDNALGPADVVPTEVKDQAGSGRLYTRDFGGRQFWVGADISSVRAGDKILMWNPERKALNGVDAGHVANILATYLDNMNVFHALVAEANPSSDLAGQMIIYEVTGSVGTKIGQEPAFGMYSAVLAKANAVN